MTVESRRLERETEVFGRYLAELFPSAYAADKYRSLSAVAPFRDEPSDRFDDALLNVARWHPALTRLADLHARFVRPTTRLRRKLILMTAILECAPGSAAVLQSSGGGPVAALASLAWIGATSALWLALGFVVFVPVRLVTALMTGPARG